MSSLRQVPITCPGHTRPVVDLDFSDITEDGYFLITASKDGKPMLRQGETGDWIGTFEGHKGAVWGATLTRQATHAATGAADFTAKVWNAVSGDELHTFKHEHIVKCVRFSHGTNHLLTGSQEKLLRIYDLNRPDAEPSVFQGHTSGVRKVIWAGDDKRIISASDDKTIRIWDVHNKVELDCIELPSAPGDLEIDPNNRYLTVPFGESVGFYDAQTFEKRRSFHLEHQLNSVSLHGDSSVFVCGGDNFILYKYNFEDGTELASDKGHFGPIHCVRFSPDGQLYASGSEDGTLRLWQTVVGTTYGLWKCVNPESEVDIKVEA